MTDPDGDLALRLARETRFSRLLHLSSCTSTQDVASELPPGDTVVWSDSQTAGRGRQGRTWAGDPGLDVEVTFRVDHVRAREPGLIAAAVPIAILMALESIADRRLALKWPNDVLCDGRKLSGVLIDAHGGSDATYVVGTGVNVNRTRFPAELRELATSLALSTGREFDRRAVVLALANAVDRAFADVVASDIDELEECFRDRLGLLGREVRLQRSGEEPVVGRLGQLGFRSVELEDGRSFSTASLVSLQRGR